MPRAKRTDRTEARRRYRAEQAALAGAEPVADEAVPAKTTANAKPKPAATGERPGITSSLRQAYRPVQLADDLRAAPKVLTHWGFLATLAGTAAIAIWFCLSYNAGMSTIPVGTATTEQVNQLFGSQILPFFLAQNIFQGPPIIGAFIIGFTAKRASWLGGLVYGIFTVILLVIVMQQPAGRLLSNDNAEAARAMVVQSAAFAPLGGALFAAALAWYRRFLYYASPNRAKQQSAVKGRGTPKQKDRPVTSRAAKR